MCLLHSVILDEHGAYLSPSSHSRRTSETSGNVGFFDGVFMLRRAQRPGVKSYEADPVGVSSSKNSSNGRDWKIDWLDILPNLEA